MTAYVPLFITAYLLTLPALVIVIFLGIIFEANDNSSSLFCAILAGIIAFFVFNLQIIDIALFGIAYILIGCVWSFWRYKHYLVEKVANWNTKVLMTASETKWFMESLTPRACLSRITSWIIVWPFSMIENIAGDLIRMITDLDVKFYTTSFNCTFILKHMKFCICNITQPSEFPVFCGWVCLVCVDPQPIIINPHNFQ